MFFVGDIALPFFDNSLPEVMPTGGIWVGNLEGSLIDKNLNIDNGVYNDLDSIRDLCSRIPFRAFGIANNHLLDCASVSSSLNKASSLGIPTFGAGDSIDEAKRSIIVHDDDTDYRVLAFGWENIQCVTASKSHQGVNPYTKANVLSCVKDALQYKEQIVCFFHWDYELERYPQPYDRHLARSLIDLGVSAVIGCHAHRVQPIEFYKGRPIVYGLGNFLFYQGHYFRGRLRFPKFCDEEYVFELLDGGNRFVLHHFKYDAHINRLNYIASEEIGSNVDFDGKAVFSCYSDVDYDKWFKKHRVHKKLPIFYSSESPFTYLVKSIWIRIRGKMIDFLTKVNLKSVNRTKNK